MSLLNIMKQNILNDLRNILLSRGSFDTYPEPVWKVVSSLNTYGTNAIEGNTFTQEDVGRVIIHGEGVKKPINFILETIQHESAFSPLPTDQAIHGWVEAALQGLRGVNSVAFTAGDPVALAKVFAKWASDNAEFQFKLGIVDGKLLTVAEVKALATMPGKEELFSKLLFLINAPAQRLATVINATGKDLAVVLGQGVEKGKFAAEVAA